MNWKLTRSLIGRAAAVSALTVGGAEATFAQTAAIASGDWSDPATWAPAEPVAGNLVTINGGLTVSVSQAGEAAGTVDLGTVAGETGNLTIGAGADLAVSGGGIPSIRVGQAANSTGNLTMTGGNVLITGAVNGGFAVGDLMVGDVGAGTMNMSGGTVTVSDEVIVGLGGPGVLNLSGGTMANDPATGRSFIAGFFDNGDGEINVSGTGTINSRFDIIVAFDPGTDGAFSLADDGVVNANFMFTNNAGFGAGNVATLTQTGGTFNARIAYVLGRGNGTSTLTHSGGTINVDQDAFADSGEFVVGDGPANSSTYNISGTADVNVRTNFVAGRDGIGVVNMTGGTIDAANVFLGDFDSSSGTMTISGGTLNLTGNLSIGGALASNAAPDRVEPNGMNGPQGQALDANGVLIVSGNGGTINVDGNLLANPSDKSSFRRDPFAPGGDNSATLAFEIFSGAGTSLIDVAGVADLDGAVIDLDLMGGFTPSIGTTFDLLTAASFGSTGSGTTQNVGFGDGFALAAEDLGAFRLAIVPGGNGVILQATVIPEPATCGLGAMALLGLATLRRKND